jgi:hypothetical protein
MSIVASPNPAAKPRRGAATAGRHYKAAPKAKAAPSKFDIVTKLLARSKGATIAEVSGATGWQAASASAANTINLIFDPLVMDSIAEAVAFRHPAGLIPYTFGAISCAWLSPPHTSR